MSDLDIGYVPYRISMKQEKLYKATSFIARCNATKKPLVKENKKRASLHNAKEVLTGVVMPARVR